MFSTLLVLSQLLLVRDSGQWDNPDVDPAVVEWYRSLRMPDNPSISCCGEADAYWVGEVHVRDGKTFATIEDDRPDEPLGRPRVPSGTVVEVPNNKLKWDRGNPTGHTVIFLGASRQVYCFVQSSGI